MARNRHKKNEPMPKQIVAEGTLISHFFNSVQELDQAITGLKSGQCMKVVKGKLCLYDKGGLVKTIQKEK